MKKLLLFALFLVFGIGAYAQTVLYTDDMESYAVNSFIAVENPTWWTTWSNNPGSGEDAQISDLQGHSPSKSILVDKVGGQTDLILKLGDKTSGAYELTWWMYIPAGKCGYYNIQHFEAPGTEWAMELYFRASGGIELNTCGDLTNSTYPHDQWFEVKHEIDIDNDNIKLYIDGVLLHEWPFSCEATGTGGTNQLGGVDFFAGESSGSGETPSYYVDDVYYAETASASNPAITVDPTSLSNELLAGTTGTQDMTVSNTGVADLTYATNIIYDVAKGEKSTPVVIEPLKEYAVKKVLGHVSSTPSNGGAPSSDATAILHYDGDNFTAIGFNTPPVTCTCAARFPNAMTVPYAGMTIESVDVFINDLNTSGSNTATIKIYGMGTDYMPGTLLHSQDFTPSGANWEHIVLTTPVTVTGEDLWVGYTFTQNDAGIFPYGADEGPNDPNGDWMSTGVGWSHLSGGGSGLDYNWNVRANLVGDPIAQWLSVAPASGTVAPAGTAPLTVTYDATDLVPGDYAATIRFITNDPENLQLDVPVALHVYGVGINEPGKSSIMVYPNPVKNVINVVTTDAVRSIVVTDIAGKVLYKGTSTSIDASNMSAGVYFVKTETAGGTATVKIIKK